ncbi:prepilin-type N-terminal cleavage/methylation domain-containing protein, partial [candidate division GN15 bacterium]|nr:prepilin-type N-terminal cleavage/methylation domain-containing protein [candidate division GN15 bacterium]
MAPRRRSPSRSRIGVNVDKLKSTSGFTLMELVIVIVVMGIIATVALRSMEAPIANARFESTRAEMDQLATAIVGNP